jgi:hypothetical protein
MRLHVVVAMVGKQPARVECLSCHKQHNYKAAPPGTKKKEAAGEPAKRARPREPASRPALEKHPLDALLAVRSESEARPYTPTDRYAVGELVRHPSFGLGAVSATPAPGKIEVVFRDFSKLLMHERPPAGAATGPKLQPPPKRNDEAYMGASDAPPPKR